MKIKICHVIGNFVNGGVESVIYNYFSHMDLSRYEVHIIGHGIRAQECADRFTALGFIIHNITPKSVSFISNIREMTRIFKENNFDIIHSHLTEWACVPMFLGWKCGVKVRINHSHMAEMPQGLKNKLYYGIRLFFGKLFATDYYACGNDAGIYLFGKKVVDEEKVTVLPNAIDYDLFCFDEKRREKFRAVNGIHSLTTVIGHVGRFYEQKNHTFLVDVFEEYHKLNPDSVLIMLGDGELFERIKERIYNKGLDECVRMLGNRSDVSDWYQAMDLFLMPSYYEGFPVVGVEAQASGLPCIFSDKITTEIQISHKVKFISLSQDASIWAKQVEKMIKNSSERINLILDRDRFDICKNADKLNRFYINSVKR